MRVNGQPGLVLDSAIGLTTIALEPDERGRIGAVHIVRNPDKLRHVKVPSAEGAAAP